MAERARRPAEPVPDLPDRSLWRERVGGNHLVELDDPEVVWIVRRGAADVFLVLPAADGAGGERRHLFRIGAGGALVGLDLGDNPLGVRVAAVATAEGELVRVALPDVRAAATVEQARRVAAVFDLWVRRVTEYLGPTGAPKEAVRAVPGQVLDLPEGGLVYAPQGILWADLLGGSVRAPSTATFAGNEPPASFVLTPQHVLRAVTAARLAIRTTQDKLIDESLWSALQALHRRAIAHILDQEQRRTRDEAERIALASRQEELVTDGAMRSIEKVLSAQQALRPVGAPRSPTGALLSAFGAVAEATGIEIKTPREAQALLRQSDPVGALARATGVSIRRVELLGDWWRREGGPMLAFRGDARRPVALIPASPHAYVVVDPFLGRTESLDQDLARQLATDARVLYRPFPPRAIRARGLLRLGLPGSGFDFSLVVSVGVAAGILAMVTPVAIGQFFDVVIPDAERSQLAQYTLLLVAAAIGSALLGLCQSLTLLRMRGKIGMHIQSAVWDRLLRLPTSFFRQYNAGDLANRALGINSISSTLAIVTLRSAFTGAFSIFSFALMVYYDWKLAIIGLLLVLAEAAVAVVLLGAQLGYQRPLYHLVGRISGQVLQIVNGMAKLRVAGAERRAFAAWVGNFSFQKKLTLKARGRANALTVFNDGYHAYSLLLILVGIAYLSQTIAIGDFAAFYAAFGQFSGGVLGVLGAFNSSMSVVPLYERAQPILQTVPETVPDASDPGDLRGEVEVDQVSFRYYETGENVLSSVSFRAAAGDFVAVVGASGAGKSTLFRLLLGFETPTSGTISYDKRNLAGLDLRALRRQLGVVLQNGRLMPGSIFENIVGTAPLSEEEAWEAARLAGLEKFIRSLPMRMHTLVSEGGGTFSGGERQRLMIARAIVKKPRVLLFDEATSTLDNQTQAAVREAVAELDATRIVIAHRLSTVEKADCIHVLERGRLVQSGRYQELIAAPGPFAELARRQLA